MNLSHHLSRPYGRQTASQRGIAMLLVLIGLAVATVLGLTFLHTQSTTAGIAQNVNHQSHARGIAESALELTIKHIQNNAAWRTTYPNGTWVTSQNLDGGTFSVKVEDGVIDANGNVVGDADLTDNLMDRIVVTAIGRYAGVSHTVRAEAAPAPADLSPIRVLMVVSNPASLTSQEVATRSQIKAWGYLVTLIDDNQTAAGFASAAAQADVVLVSPSVTANAGSALATLPVGIVNTTSAMYASLGLTSASATAHTGSMLNITDNTHYITAPFTVGNLVILNQSNPLHHATGSLASGASVLGQQSGTSAAALTTVEAGAVLQSGIAAGRRVCLPWGGSSFAFTDLNENGLILLHRALQWASASPSMVSPVLHYDFTEQTGLIVHDRYGNTDLQIMPGNGTVSWVADANGQGLYFNQSTTTGTAAARTATPGTADDLKNLIQASNTLTVQVFFRMTGGHASGAPVISYAEDEAADEHNLAILGTPAGSGFNSTINLKHSQGLTRLPKSNLWSAANATVVAFTYNPAVSNKLKVFVNGVYSHEDAAPKGNLSNWASWHMTLGNEASLNRPFKGYIYDVKIWDKALSASQLKAQATQLQGAVTDGSIPNQLVRYDFQKVQPTPPQLVGYWKLNENTGANAGEGFGVSAVNKVDLKNNAQIDSYDSTSGDYGGNNVSAAAPVSTNSTLAGKLIVRNTARLSGNAYCGVNGTPSSVIALQNQGAITGTAAALTAVVDIPASMAWPNNMPVTQGNMILSTTNTWSTNQRFAKLELNGSAKITIQGNVTIQCDGDFKMKDNAQILLAKDANLVMYVGGKIDLSGNSHLNADSENVDRLHVYQLSPQSFSIKNQNVSGDKDHDGDSDKHGDKDHDGDGDKHGDKDHDGDGDKHGDKDHDGDGDKHGDKDHDGDGDKENESEDAFAMCGVVYTQGNFILDNSAQFCGLVKAYGNIELKKNAQIHVDLAHTSSVGGAGGNTTAVDAAALSNGTYTQGPLGLQAGKIGTAVHFDGHNDYVFIPHHDAYLLNNGSVSFWFKADQLSGQMGLFSKDSDLYDTGGHLNIHLHGSIVEARLQSTSASYIVQSPPINAGQWYHLTFTWGVDGMKLYLNGALVGTQAYTGGLATTSGGAGNYEPIVLGADSSSSANIAALPLNSYFKGLMDDVRIYATALNTTQIASVMAGNLPLAPTSAVLVKDTSSFAQPLDLTLHNPENVTWLAGGGLRFITATRATSDAGASTRINALRATNAMTLDLIFTPANLTQSGPASIVSMAGSNGKNFTFGQNAKQYVWNMRTTSTDANGNPAVTSGNVLNTAVQHVVITWDGQVVKIYRNGKLEITQPLTGSFSGWDNHFRLILGNQDTTDQPWLGTLQRVSLYDRALTVFQVQDLFNGDPLRSTTDVTHLAFRLRWYENP